MAETMCGVMEQKVMACGGHLTSREVDASREEKPEGIFGVGGESRLTVGMHLHALNRNRLCTIFCTAISDREDCVIVMKGGTAKMRDSSDHEEIFRQESFFHWAFGVKEPGCYGVLEPKTGHGTLFVPRLPADSAVWMGRIASKEEWKRQYSVDEVLYVDELSDFIGNRRAVYYPVGVNTDSGSVQEKPDLPSIQTDCTEEDFLQLYELIAELRAVKTPLELEVMRYAAKASSTAHVKIMQSIRPGMYEFEFESLFLHTCYAGFGCRHTSYTCICGSGPNGAILHYGHAGAPNDRLIRDGDMCLIDMGAEYHCYASDITCSYPANGRFTEDQRKVYEAVLAAQRAVLAQLRPGVNWTSMHLLAETTILSMLREAGFVEGDVEEMLEARLGAVFMPHGLGHLIGIDTHDVGGTLRGHPKRNMVPGLSKLRISRNLRENMVVTVEPGVYFVRTLLESALQSPEHGKFLCRERIEPLMEFGGIRLEDVVRITADGYENFTSVPREVEDVEQVMAGKPWPDPQG